MNRLLSVAAVLLLFTACTTPSSAAPKIQVQNAWARPTMAGAMTGMAATPTMPGMTTADMPVTPGMTGSEATSAAYFVIVNDGGAADALIGAAADVAGTAELHETKIVNDVAQMVPVTRVEVPAHGRVEFKPEGYHVMLMGLKHDLKEGDTVKLTLQFEKSGAVNLDVPVRSEPPQ
jgi:copper(I)-binding protein